MTTTVSKDSTATRKQSISTAPPSMKVLAVKILFLAIVDAVAVFAMSMLFFRGDWLVLGIVAVTTLLVNIVYLSPGLLPGKYLTPGLIFLAVFQVFVVVYSLYIAFTNYGDGHNSTKEDAISAIVLQNTQRVEGSPTYRVQLVEGPGDEPAPLGGETRDEMRVLDALSTRAARSADELAIRTGMAPSDVSASLALLELGGRAVERGNGWMRSS